MRRDCLKSSYPGFRWEKLVKEGIIQWAEEKKASGQIRHLGFSFHDTYPVFRKILTYRQWDFCQIQYNYIDTQIQAGDKGYEFAAKMGVPMVIMEPVKGGRLAELPEEVEEVLKEADPDRSVASYALRWVGSHENVKVILSGMSSMEQLEDNLETFGKFQPLTELEEEAVEKAADLIRSRMKNGCTSCRYCMPSPSGITALCLMKQKKQRKPMVSRRSRMHLLTCVKNAGHAKRSVLRDYP